MSDQNKVIEAFIKYRVYAKAAREVGLSRQRVEQIVKSRKGLPKALFSHNQYKKCSMCKRVFGKDLRHASKGRCSCCSQYKISHKRRGRVVLRHITYPNNCLMCGEETKLRERVRGMHEKCFHKTDYYRKFNRERMKRYIMSHHAEYLIKQRVYNRNAYQKRKEAIRNLNQSI